MRSNRGHYDIMMSCNDVRVPEYISKVGFVFTKIDSKRYHQKYQCLWWQKLEPLLCSLEWVEDEFTNNIIRKSQIGM